MTNATRCSRTCSSIPGMRLGEASCLLVPELPGERAAASGLGAIHLGAAVTKRSRARTVFAPPRLVRALDRYARIERGELVARISAGGGTRSAGRRWWCAGQGGRG